MRRPRTSLGRAAAPLALAALLCGAGAPGVAGPAPATAASGPSGVTAIARRQYFLEIHGGAAFAALQRVGGDPALLRKLQSGNLAATRAYVQRTFAAPGTAGTSRACGSRTALA